MISSKDLAHGDTPQADRNSLAWVVKIMLPLVVADLMATFESAMVLAALKTMIEEYGDPPSVGWMVTGYLLVSAAAAAIVGRLGDIYGRKPMLIVVMAVAVVGSLISALAESLEVIVVGRAIQGFALVILPLCFGLMREHLPAGRIPTCIGWITATSTVGSTLGLVGGGMLVDQFDWRSIFVASTIFGLVAITVAAVCLPRSVGVKRSAALDWLGGLLLAPAVAALLFALSSGAKWGWTHPVIFASGLGGSAVLAIWTWHELRCPDPLVDLGLLRNRDVAIAYGCIVLAALSSMQILQFFMLFAQQPEWTGTGLGLSATLAGTLKVPAMIMTIISTPIAGWVCGRRGSRLVVVIGLGLCTASWLGMLLHPAGVYWAATMFALCSVGVGIVYTAIPSLIVAVAPVDRIGEATGFLTVIRALLAAVGAQMMMTLLGSSTVSHPGTGAGQFPSPDAYGLTLLVFVSLSLVATVLALRLPTGKTVANN